MSSVSPIDQLLEGLNPQQRAAALHGRGPLLIVAGAGTGKTATLVHRVAWLIATGTDPGRILLLTFTRRAAAEMLRRVESVLARLGVLRARAASKAEGAVASRVWGGTFHAVATRLLRHYAKAVGLPHDFTILDRTDAEDLMHVCRTDLGLAKTDRRFPRKTTCLDIYSRCVNSQERLSRVLATDFPWCREWADALKKLFEAYTQRKQAAAALDYDDLLLFWHALLGEPNVQDQLRALFDCVLVDEYQDTNTLQAEILYRLRPDGTGLTVVGDDAQSIYAFRGATVRNILDFPKHYPETTVITLEQNYRSTQPILNATNHVISLARERYTKNLWTERKAGDRPWLVACHDEAEQSDFVIRQVLSHREAGIDLRRQAVLFRASHHSMILEAELVRRNIPFHKYGGLKFIETAHVKDLLAFLRLAENPRDLVSGIRLLALLPGIGPGKARKLMDALLEAGGDFRAWATCRVPAPAAELWPQLVELLAGLAAAQGDLAAQVHRVRTFYTPLLEELYDYPYPRARDLEQLEQIASRYSDRRTMLAELALDPPSSSQDLAGPPLRDDDFLVLSTIHSAKGLEWDVVYIIHATDGNIPSDMATGSTEQIEEERRLFYVALTRAKRYLCVCYPLRYYLSPGSMRDAYGLPQLSRFLTPAVCRHFQCSNAGASLARQTGSAVGRARRTGRAVRPQTQRLWD